MSRPLVIVVARVKRLLATIRTRAARATLPDSQWGKMPGQRQELIGTGFEIRMEPRLICGEKQMVFCGYDPEGREIAYTPGNLQGLKELLEQNARARQEFDL